MSKAELPALEQLKGRCKVFLISQDANLVVSGDVDLVVDLGAAANHKDVELMGVIEEPGIRDTIVSTVDGGEEPIRLRLRKYGF